MAKSARASRQPAKARMASRTKSLTKPSMGNPVTLDAASGGWATDLVFDVREPKLAVSLRLDADVLRFFRAFGAGYQTRINEVLKAFMHARCGADAVVRASPAARAKHVASSNGKRPRNDRNRSERANA